MFRELASQLATGTNAEKKSMSPQLRGDIYTALDQAKGWILGGGANGGSRPGKAGDGVSYSALLTIIQRHFPKTEMGLDAIGHTDAEIALIVGGITNMIIEMSKWEGMAGGMAMRTWVDSLVEVYGKTKTDGGSRQEAISQGITKAITQNVDVSIMPKEFTTRIQIISSLKTLVTSINESGTPKARQAEAALSSKFI